MTYALRALRLLAVGVLLAALFLFAASTVFHYTPVLIIATALFLLAGVVVGRWGRVSLWQAGVLICLPMLVLSANMLAQAERMQEGLSVILIFGYGSGTALGLLIGARWGAYKRQLLAAGAGYGLVLALLAGVAVPALEEKVAEASTIKEVVEVDPFVLRTLEGGRVGSDELAGKVVLLDFWGVWCAPCVRQMPDVQAAYDKYRDDERVAFFAVNTAEGGDTPEKIKDFMAQRGFTIPVAVDSAQVLRGHFDIVGLPQTLLLDRRGRIRVQHLGYAAGDFAAKLTSEIETLLAEDG